MHGPTRSPSQDSAMFLFTKVYDELSLRIQQSLRRCNNRSALKRLRSARASGAARLTSEIRKRVSGVRRV